MSRTKKEKNTVVPNNENTTSETEASLGFSYQGRVTISLVNGKTVLSKTTYNNKGGDAMFNYLAQCLMGKLNTGLQPKYIICAENKAETPAQAYPIQAEGKAEVKKYSEKIIMNNVAESVIDGVYTTTLHFIIPKAYLISSSGKINELLLVSDYMNAEGSQVTSPDYSAYYYLVDDKGQWNPTDIKDISGNTNMIVDWELSVTNSTTGV